MGPGSFFALARRVRAERGQTSAEYIGVLVVACAIVAVLLNAGIGELLAAKLKQQIVAVATDQESGGGGSSAGEADRGGAPPGSGGPSEQSRGRGASGPGPASEASGQPGPGRAEAAGGAADGRAAPSAGAQPPARPAGDSQSLYERGVTAVGVSPESAYEQRQAAAGATVGFVKGIAGDRVGDAVSAAMGGEEDATFAKGEKVGEAGSWAGGLAGFAFKAGRKGFTKVVGEFAEEGGERGAQGTTKFVPPPSVSALEQASHASFKAAQGPINISRKHLPGARGRYNKFEEGVDVDGVVREGLRSPNATFRPNPAGGYRVDTDLSRPIGQGGRTTVRSIVSPDGRVITAFPYGPKRP